MDRLFTPEFIGVIGVPTFILLVTIGYLGWRIEKIAMRVEDMKDEFSQCINSLGLEIKENNIVQKGIEGILREMRDIERKKLDMREKELAEKEERKVA